MLRCFNIAYQHMHDQVRVCVGAYRYTYMYMLIDYIMRRSSYAYAYCGSLQ